MDEVLLPSSSPSLQQGRGGKKAFTLHPGITLTVESTVDLATLPRACRTLLRDLRTVKPRSLEELAEYLALKSKAKRMHDAAKAADAAVRQLQSHPVISTSMEATS